MLYLILNQLVSLTEGRWSVAFEEIPVRHVSVQHLNFSTQPTVLL